MMKFKEKIKYFAIAIAVLLAIGIIIGVTGMIFGFDEEEKLYEENVEIEISQNISGLNIDVGSAEFRIIEGEHFTLSSNIKNLKVSENNEVLHIEKKQKKISIHSTKVGEIILTVPVGTVFDSTSIDLGAGNMQISCLVTEILKFDFGAGKAHFDYLEVRKSASVEVGAGKLQIKDGKIHNLDIDFGVGKSALRAFLTGRNEIDCGVGATEFVLLGNKNDYSIEMDVGAGNIHVDGCHICGNVSIGNGSNTVLIDGGVGSVNILFENE